MDRFFPFGVRMFYKLFAADNVVVIEPDPSDRLLGIKAWNVSPKWLPEGVRDKDGVEVKPRGMRILWRLPTKQLRPEPLVAGSFAEFQKVLYKVQYAWHGKDDFKKHIEDWKRFADIVPKSDDIDEYLLTHPEQFHVPFRSTLFKGKFYAVNIMYCTKFYYLLR